MKNIIKIITVLAIVTSFFSVYSMEESDKTTTIRNPFLTKAQLFHVENLNFFQTMEEMRTLQLRSIEQKSSGTTVPGELILLLNAIKLIENPYTRDKCEILNAIRQEAAATFNYKVLLDSVFFNVGRIEYSQDPVPLYTSTKNWFQSSLNKKNQAQEKNLSRQKSFKDITFAIIKGKSKNKNEKSGVLATCILNKFEIKIPEVIADFIVLLLPECNSDEEERELNKLNRWIQ